MAPRALQCGTLHYCLQPPGVQRVPTTRPLLHSAHPPHLRGGKKPKRPAVGTFAFSGHLCVRKIEKFINTASVGIVGSDRCRYMISYLAVTVVLPHLGNGKKQKRPTVGTSAFYGHLCKRYIEKIDRQHILTVLLLISADI